MDESKAQELDELKSTKREQDQEIAGDTQTRQDKINLSRRYYKHIMKTSQILHKKLAMQCQIELELDDYCT